MHVITRAALVEFASRYPDAAEPLDVWCRIAKAAEWRTPRDVRAQFGNASVLGDERVVFDIAGNKYRLVVSMRYRRSKCYIRHVPTHREYDALTQPTDRLQRGVPTFT